MAKIYYCNPVKKKLCDKTGYAISQAEKYKDELNKMDLLR